MHSAAAEFFNNLFSEPVAWFHRGVMFGFLILALWEFRHADRWPKSAFSISGAYAVVMLGVFVVGALATGLVGFAFGGTWRTALTLGGSTLAVGFSNTLLGAVFLASALGLRRRGGRDRPRRLLPAADWWRIWRRSFKRHGRPLRAMPNWSWLGPVECVFWTAAMLIFSYFWLDAAAQWMEARVSPELIESAEGMPHAGFGLQMFLFIAMAPFYEEVLFRGFVQERLLIFGRVFIRSRAVALTLSILLTSGFWAMGHMGRIEPDWVKLVQIGGIGVALGLARWRLGLEACVVMHLLFNLIGGFYLPPEFSAI